MKCYFLFNCTFQFVGQTLDITLKFILISDKIKYTHMHSNRTRISVYNIDYGMRPRIIAFPLVIFLVSDRIRDCGDFILIKFVKIGKTDAFSEQQSRIFNLSFNGARHSSSLNCWRPFSVI